MDNRIATFCLSLIFAFGLPRTAHGIECYRCISTNSSRPFLCNEFLTEDSLESLMPESCDDVYGAAYCIKHVGRFEGGIGTKRFCSSKHLGNYCDYVQQPGDKLNYRTCVFTCKSDGCNSATTTSPSQFTQILLSAVLISFSFACLR